MTDRPPSRLAAILALDVAGYSRLMEADEAATLGRLKEHRGGFWSPEIARHGGRVVGSAGDGLLAEFPSAVAAVDCALSLQLGMERREAGLPEERRMRLRIGINVGEIVPDGPEVYGDSVNVAARLEGLATPGGLTLSAAQRAARAGRRRARTRFRSICASSSSSTLSASSGCRR